MTRVNLLDAAFLLVDSEVSPKHVGALQVFELPAHADEGFVGDLYRQLPAFAPTEPFNLKLKSHLVGLPEWVTESVIDWSYHLHHLAVPDPRDQRELNRIVAELHARALDRSKPLWQVYLIEGLKPRHFAVYIKIHHAYGDGITIGGWLNDGLSPTKQNRLRRALWQPRRGAAGADDTPAALGALPLSVVPDLYRMVARGGLHALGLSHRRMPLPFRAPHTPFNVQVTQDRSLATQSLELAALQAVGRATGTTVNDVLLTVCDLALRAYLESHGVAPERPLVAQMPISLRRPGSVGGNQVTMALVELGSGAIRDPLVRLHEIHASCRDIKTEYKALSPEATTLYIALLSLLLQAGESLKLTERMPALGNVLVSNIPGPERTMYFDGARLVRAFPVSTFAPGLVINLTVYSYAGGLHCGLLGARSAIPDLDRLGELMEESLERLVAAVAANRA